MTAPESGPVDLSGHTAVVTGAAGAIGAASCGALAREGADVVATDVDEAGLDGAIERVESHGASCTAVGCDVTEPSEVDALRDAALSTHDGVEVLVLAHGVVSTRSLAGLSLSDLRAVLDVNLTGTALVTMAFWDHLLDAGYGKVVAIGSIAGKAGGVISGPDYAASKGGVHALVKDAAREGAPEGVYANAIAPGPVRSPMIEGLGYEDDMTPLNRLGEPADVAEAVVFLSSPASNWITGTVLDVNGGMLME